ncbi:MAG: Fn3-like domain-containing protein [bacterium]
MNTTRLGVVVSLLFSTLLLVAPLSVGIAHADTLTVSPPKFELFGNPGDTVNENLKVTNSGSSDATYQTKVEDFKAAGDQGGIDLVEDPKAPKTTYSLAKWMTVEPSSFTVPAGQQKVINISIRIPKSGEPGGHYASVQVRLAGDAVVGGGASVITQLNSLILLRVSGNITEQLSLDSFKTDDSYYQHGPIAFNLRSTNTGNVHVAPSGTIVITDIFGRKVKELPLTEANALPGGSRSVNTIWEDSGYVGKYTATLVANYGQSKVPLTATTSFIIFPLLLVWICLGVIVVLLLLITQRKKVRRIINNLTRD